MTVVLTTNRRAQRSTTTNGTEGEKEGVGNAGGVTAKHKVLTFEETTNECPHHEQKRSTNLNP